jgi:hypothetical protein
MLGKSNTFRSENTYHNFLYKNIASILGLIHKHSEKKKRNPKQCLGYLKY